MRVVSGRITSFRGRVSAIYPRPAGATAGLALCTDRPLLQDGTDEFLGCTHALVVQAVLAATPEAALDDQRLMVCHHTTATEMSLCPICNPPKINLVGGGSFTFFQAPDHGDILWKPVGMDAHKQPTTPWSTYMEPVKIEGSWSPALPDEPAERWDPEEAIRILQEGMEEMDA